MVLNRKDQRLISPAERAQDGIDMRAALNTLSTKRLQMMETVRTGVAPGLKVPFMFTEAEARGWLEFESDLGDALLEIQSKRGEGVSF